MFPDKYSSVYRAPRKTLQVLGNFLSSHSMPPREPSGRPGSGLTKVSESPPRRYTWLSLGWMRVVLLAHCFCELDPPVIRSSHQSRTCSYRCAQEPPASDLNLPPCPIAISLGKDQYAVRPTCTGRCPRGMPWRERRMGCSLFTGRTSSLHARTCTPCHRKAGAVPPSPPPIRNRVRASRLHLPFPLYTSKCSCISGENQPSLGTYLPT